MFRSITLFFLVAAFCLVTAPGLPSNAEAQQLLGDVSENGQISAYDAALAAQYAVGLISLTPSQIANADVTGNGSVSASDAAWIALKSVDPTVKFPAEDPTPTPTTTPTPAPSAYEGFGTVTRGALDAPGGYETYHVTNLNNSGAGSLRDAVSQGSRYVVFDVGGTITLTSTLRINDPYITIDGASAPSPGITIIQTGTTGTVIEGTSDIIIHHLRMDGQATAHENAGDIWGLDGSDAPVSNVIIDHVTAIASTDGVFDMPGVVKDVTISWNLITDTVTAMLVKYGRKDRISLHHNVFARNSERQPQLVDEIYLMDYVNNVVYGWGWNGWGYGVRIPDTGGSNTYPTLNFENNVFHYVSGYSSENSALIRYQDGAVYFNGNIFPPGENDNYSTSTRHVIPNYAAVTKYDASTLGDTVVPFAGTHYPTAAEQNLLSEIRLALGG